MSADAALEKALAIIASQNSCVLATTGLEGPYTSLMAYAPIDGGRRLVLVMEKGSKKYRNLKHDSRVSILVDTRASGAEREKIVALTLAGRAVLDADQTTLGQIFEKNHPGFPLLGRPSSVFVPITISSILMLNGPEKAQFFSLPQP
ncbi:MAG: pyridoxamine 5'-phosphate oxidase family protein [Desulfatibacillaceae bacterium]|nr:pyridoxamine 5'-phosphate oxidase family protein [Desulfatibacillaceae bacterium]